MRMSVNDTEIKVDGFGIVPSQANKNSYEIIKRYTLTNKTKASVRLITWGAGIQSIRVPNSTGILGDVILGFDDINGYLNNRFIGRVLGCDTHKKFNHLISSNNKKSLNENQTNKFSNNRYSFDNANWSSHVLDKQVIMSHLSDEDDNGKTLTQVKYSWSDQNELHVNIRATLTKPSSVDVSNCYLFNLAGHGMGSDEFKNHIITVNADELISIDSHQMKTKKKIFDLRCPTLLDKKRLYMIPGGGYNHVFSESKSLNDCYRFHARILHPQSGRILEVFSNQPGFHFYTAHSLFNFRKRKPLKNERKSINGKDGIVYEKHGGFLIAPCNQKAITDFHDVSLNILNPGYTYHHNMTFKFGIKDTKSKFS